MRQHPSNPSYSKLDFTKAHQISGSTQDPTPSITTERNGAEGTTTRKTHKVFESAQVNVLRYEYDNLDVLDFIVTTPNCKIDVYIFRSAHSPMPTIGNDSLAVDIDGELLLVLPATERQVMRFTTGDYDDQIHVHDPVVNPIEIYSGDGDDRIISDSPFSDIYAGAGNDDISLTGYRGYSHVEGGEGDDEINAAGFPHGTFYGGPGSDTIRGSTITSVILGGQGDDTLTGGGRLNIICAGPGDDRIEAGDGRNTIYTSEGFNRVKKLKATDTTYHNVRSELAVDCTKITKEQMDAFPPGQIASNAIHLEPKPLDLSAFVIQGSPSFIDRAKDDFYLLNASPTGQRLLDVLRQAFITSGKPITINELGLKANGEFVPDDKVAAQEAYIKNGKAGTPAYGGHIWYSTRNTRSATPSVFTLFHELCHAYNQVTGTKLPGTSLDADLGPGKPREQISNVELQAVGLPTETEPFDFDGDPNTPPTTTNPQPFSENGLRKELGWFPRRQYNPSGN